MAWRRFIRLGAVGAVAAAVSFGASGCQLLVPPKIMIVMMENNSFSEVVGQTATEPYTNALAQGYGLATQAYAFGHPSLPDYLDLVSGSNQGVTDDGAPSEHSFPAAPTLANQLVSAGFSVAAFAEDLPADPTNDAGEYMVHHVPWEYFPNAPITVKDASDLVPDLNAASPPDFVWFTPNAIDDEHNGTVEQGDSFLSRFIPEVQATSWYKTGGQIIILWDESDTDNADVTGGVIGGGHVPLIVVSKALAAHPTQYAGKVATAGVLDSIEHLYLAPDLGDANAASNGNIGPLLSW